MSSTAMALWSAGGANSVACSPFNGTCWPPPVAAAASHIDVINFSSKIIAPKATRTTTATKAMPKKQRSSSFSSSSSSAAAADHVTRSVNVTSPARARIIGSFGNMISRLLVSRPNNSCTYSPFSRLASSSSSSSTTASSITEEEQEEEGGGGGEMKRRIGARVKVKVPLKVYHVPRVPEVDLTGMEGHLKQFVGLWKGKRISANLPYKVEFVLDVQGRGPVKFFAHLKEDEFEFLN